MSLGDELPKSSSYSLPDFVEANKVPLAGFLVGLLFLGVGVLLYKGGLMDSGDKMEIITTETASASSSATIDQKPEIVVEISGAIVKPGVYKLAGGSRIEDLLIASGGLAADADRLWVDKYINRAAKLIDGQKIYIYKNGELVSSNDNQSEGGSARNSMGVKQYQGGVEGSLTSTLNINTASLSELDSLPGIGQVYGQSIIDHRPYSSTEELVSKEVISQSIFDKLKEKISVY
jgi:competence protein ComEA